MEERTDKDMAIMTKTLIQTGVPTIPTNRIQDYLEILEWLDDMCNEDSPGG